MQTIITKDNEIAGKLNVHLLSVIFFFKFRSRCDFNNLLKSPRERNLKKSAPMEKNFTTS